MPGDVNGDGEISVEDAQRTLKAYTERTAGKDNGLTDAQIKAADINGNGEVSVDDAQLILKYYTEKFVAGKNITWDDLLGKKPQAQPRPDLLTLDEDIWIDAGGSFRRLRHHEALVGTVRTHKQKNHRLIPVGRWLFVLYLLVLL